MVSLTNPSIELPPKFLQGRSPLRTGRTDLERPPYKLLTSISLFIVCLEEPLQRGVMCEVLSHPEIL